MVRKLAAAMLGVGVFIPGLANALGLGEIKLNSALSEPLDAEIELVQVRELTATEILPELASSDDFTSANVERFHFLTDLKFEVMINSQGKSVIKIRSRKPVKEPFLNFLVEVNWPAGRLLREYTLLLDPPIYSSQKADPVKPVQTTSAAPKPSATQPVSTYQGVTSSQTDYSTGSYAEGAQTQTHTIGSNDSLWAIAKQMKPSDRVSIQQTMMAIQRINPDAFINNNINLLKKGQVLRAPTEDEAMQLSSREAIALASEQNRQWRDRASGTSQADTQARQIDLSGRSVTREQEPSTGSSDDRLKLVSGSSDGTGDSGQGGAGIKGQLRDQLVAAEENVDKFKLENEELKLKVDDLEDQLDTSEKVLTLKDEQIAALQAKLRELEQLQKQAVTDIGSEPDLAIDSEAIKEPAPDVESAADQDVMAGELIAPESTESAEQEVDFNYEEESVAEMPTEEMEEGVAIGPEDTPSAEEQPDLAGVTVDEAPQPTPAEPEKPEGGLVQQILSNPIYLGAGAGAIILLLVIGIMASRRKQNGEEFDEQLDDDFELPEAQSADDLLELDSVDLEEDDAFEEAVEASAEEETVPQTSDVIGEADIYIAYGRFPQAIEMLENAADKEPERSDIRLKLCEVCAEANEPEVFMNHYRALQGIGTAVDISKADVFREKLGPIAEAEPVESDEPAAEPSLDASPDEDATIIAEPQAESSFDFDDSDDALSSGVDNIEAELDKESDTGLDFDLADLEDTGATFEPSELTEDSGDVQNTGEVAGLDFDLNLDLEDEESAELDNESLDFDLDESSLDISAPTTEETKSDEDVSSLDFDADFSLDDLPDSPAADDTAASLGGDLSMDFDSLETDAAPSAEAPAGASEEPSMDFDLDFDSASVDLNSEETPLDEDATLLQQPAADAPIDLADANEEPMLDSQSAAQLADELDLDLDADFLDTPAEPTAEDEISTPADNDVTVVADFAAPETPAAANDVDESAEEMDFLSDADEASTKLDLARAYIDMGDRDGAKDILDEVMVEGNDNQKLEAKDLLTRLES